MSQEKPLSHTPQISRRDFLKASAGATAALAGSLHIPAVHAAGDDTIKFGLIGCGGRGSGAAGQALQAKGTVLWAVGDLFPDRAQNAMKNFANKGEQFKVTPERCFVGFDAYKQVIASGVDAVILATPPGFRPQHFRAAVEAGKHAFIEKPVAVCPTGVRSIIESGELARQKGLSVVAGTCYRRHAGYIETMKRLRDGAIGDILSGEAYYMTGALWSRPRQDGWSDMEYQCRNWYYFTWLSGDFNVEQHVHSLDIANWGMGGHPVKAYGMGGRQTRTAEVFGNIFDHFAIQYEYENGGKVISMCRQQEGCQGRVSESFAGTKGMCFTSNQRQEGKGPNPWQWEGKTALSAAYVQELVDLVDSIRAGKPLNEAREVAECSLTAIMGRMSAYTGKEVTWEQALNSKLDLTFDKLEFGPRAFDPIPVPGKTPLI